MFSTRPGTTYQDGSFNSFLYFFRRQPDRSIEEVDKLVEFLNYSRAYLGEEKFNQIKADPEPFYNNERFNIWQKKAYFRAFLITPWMYMGTIVATKHIPYVSCALNAVKFRAVTRPALAVSLFVTNFYVLHRYVGYRDSLWVEQETAKHIKMLRNVNIRK